MVPGDAWLIACEALLWAKRDEKRKAEQVLQKALRGSKTLIHIHHMWHTAAAAYALIGKPAQAIALLRKAAAMGFPNYTVFRDDPHFRPLHNNPQFLRLMADLRKEWTSHRREFGRATEDART